jgi:hypothetical protein
MITKIISGGQTGADRAALDFAIHRKIPHGGWIPKGRITEEGPLPDHYRLREMDTRSYAKRTEQNVSDSDGTLILSHGKLSGGSALTRRLAKNHLRPWLHINLDESSIPEAAEQIKKWIAENRIRILNIAGPRASKDAKIYRKTLAVLKIVFLNGVGKMFH